MMIRNTNKIKYINNSFLILAFFILFKNLIFSQTDFNVYYLNNYTKLPTNFVKATIRDNLGFIWLATDNGLYRFDGSNTEIFNDPYNSKYFKNFYKDDDKIFVLSDNGISLMKFENGQHKILPFLKGNTIKVDSNTFYPKEILVDSRKNTWVSEPVSILKLNKNSHKRYDFPSIYFTQSYTRSFIFNEDTNKRILASSQIGKIFVYEEKSDKFLLIPFEGNFNSSIDAFHIDKYNNILVGGSQGLFKIIIEKNYSSARFYKISNIKNISSIKSNQQGEYFVGSWTEGLYFSNGVGSSFRRINECQFVVISNINIDEDGTVWISSDEGVAFLQRLLFHHISLSPNAYYIQYLRKSTDGKILVTEGNSVFEVTIEKDKIISKSIYDKKTSLIRSIVGDKNDLWIGFSDGFLINLKGNRSKNIILSDQPSGNNVVYFLEKHNDFVWGIKGETRELFRIDKDYNFTFIESIKKYLWRINVLKKSKDGNLYLAGKGFDRYLFKYNPLLNEFENVSKPLKLDSKSPENFEVYDMDFDSYGNIWLLSNAGLVKYSKEKAEIVDELNKLGKFYFKSIALDRKDRVWIGTENGFLFYENDSSLTFFDQGAGISNVSNTFRTALVDKSNRVLFGTAKGLAFQKFQIDKLEKTPKPICFTKQNDSLIFLNSDSIAINYGHVLNLKFISLTYPRDNVFYIYKVSNLSDKWSEISTKNELILSELDFGDYIIEIKAIQQGKTWSDVVKIKLIVNKPFYLSNYALILYLIILIFTFFAVRKFYYLQKEKNTFKEQLNLFFKITKEILIIVDNDLKLIYINPFGQEFFNLNDNYKGRDIIDILPDNLRKRFKENINQLKSSNQNVNFVAKLNDNNNNEFFYQFNISHSAISKLIYINASDVSDIKKLELKLQETNANKDKLFSIIAHDLKGPFLGLQNLTEIMLESCQNLSREEALETVKKLNSLISKTFNLLKNLLDWSQIQLNTNIFRSTEVNVKNVLEDVLKVLSSRTEEKNIKIINNLRDDLIVKADKTMLNSVFLNLITNSIKFSHTGGEIIVDYKDLNDGFLQLSVKDYGIGIPENLKEKLFKISEKVSRKGTLGEESSGLGLVLCKEFIEKNSGKIWFESQENQGTTFYFTVPLVKKEY